MKYGFVEWLEFYLDVVRCTYAHSGERDKTGVWKSLYTELNSMCACISNPNARVTSIV
jgi:hypothetical protein